MLAKAEDPKPPTARRAQARGKSGTSGIRMMQTISSREPPIISCRPPQRGVLAVSQMPPRKAPNDSDAASTPTKIGETWNTIFPMGATSAE